MKGKCVLVIIAVQVFNTVVIAQDAPVSAAELQETTPLTLDNTGLFSYELGLTNIYQQNVHGGLSTHKRAGRYTGSYDVGLTTDLKRLFGIDDAIFYTHVEGFWPRTEGIDAGSVGSFYGVNGDAMPRDAAVITEMWYQQNFADDTLAVRVGKMDITGGFECSGCPVSFDCMRYANDETQQFLNSALVNNPTIPFPYGTLGAVVHYTPIKDWYISAGAADATGDYRETGFNTAFESEDNLFYVAETGITPSIDFARGPLQGAYRVGAWYQPETLDEDEEVAYYDNAGTYLNLDQLLIKENDDKDDVQGLGTFFRLGYADPTKNAMSQFYSTGLSYQGLIDGRNDDVLAAGIGQGYFSNHFSEDYADDSETVYEVFYNAHVSKWMTLTPSIQYVADPAETGDEASRDTLIVGLRAQMVF
jgi:porin